MIPGISGGLDHIHVYAPDRSEAAKWYEDTLGFRAVDALKVWAEDKGGPLTIENKEGSIHLALFSRDYKKPVSIAFGVTASEYKAWKVHLAEKRLDITESDHDLSWSIYTQDPYGNEIEFTTYEVDKL